MKLRNKYASKPSPFQCLLQHQEGQNSDSPFLCDSELSWYILLALKVCETLAGTPCIVTFQHELLNGQRISTLHNFWLLQHESNRQLSSQTEVVEFYSERGGINLAIQTLFIIAVILNHGILLKFKLSLTITYDFNKRIVQ